MPGVLSALSASARLAYPAIVRGVREGLSLNRLQAALQEANLGIRRATLLSLMQRERALVSAGESMRFLPRAARPDPARLPEALTILRRQFSFTVELRGRSLQTGERTTQHVTVASDRLLTRAEIEDVAERFGQQGGERYGMEVERVLFVKAMKAGAGGVL